MSCTMHPPTVHSHITEYLPTDFGVRVPPCRGTHEARLIEIGRAKTQRYGDRSYVKTPTGALQAPVCSARNGYAFSSNWDGTHSLNEDIFHQPDRHTSPRVRRSSSSLPQVIWLTKVGGCFLSKGEDGPQTSRCWSCCFFPPKACQKSATMIQHIITTHAQLSTQQGPRPPARIARCCSRAEVHLLRDVRLRAAPETGIHPPSRSSTRRGSGICSAPNETGHVVRGGRVPT